MEERQDPLTGEWFFPERSNQLFANRRNQIAYNNRKAKTERQFLNQTNHVLARNRKILLKILKGEEENVVSKQFLAGARYRFDMITAQQTHEDYTYFMCYEIGIRVMANGNIIIKNFKHE